MSIFDFFRKNNEPRILTSADLARLLDGGASTSGATVTDASAMRFATVYACVRLLAECVAQLPCHVYVRNRDGSKTRVTDIPLAGILSGRPNSWQTTFEFFEFIVSGLALRGNSYNLKITDRHGSVTGLIPFSPAAVSPERISYDRAVYHVTMADGRRDTYDAERIMHIRGLTSDGFIGMSPIAHHRETIGLAMTAEKYGARLFRNQARPGGIIKIPGRLSPEGHKNLLESWRAAHSGENIGGTAILEEGGEFQTLSMSNEDAQYLDVRQFQRTEICSIFRIPPHMIGDLTKSSFSNITQQSLEFVKYTILPWCRRIESAIQRDLLSDQDRKKGMFVQFLVDGLERADIKTRYEAYRTGIFGGFLSPNEVRRRENMDPRPNGDIYLAPLNMVDSSRTMQEPEPAKAGSRSAAKSLRPEELKGVETREALRRRYQPSFRRMAELLTADERELVLAAIKKADDPSEALSVLYRDKIPVRIAELFGDLVAEYARKVSAAALAEAESDSGPSRGELTDYTDFIMAGFSARHCASSHGQLTGILAELPPGEDPGQAVSGRLDEWAERRPEKIASREVVQQESAVARFAWMVAGVTLLRWVRRGSKSCPFCTDLDGRVVGIEAPFIEAGNYQPAGSENSPWKVRGPKMHAPLHQGCQCVIVPVTEG